MMNMSRFSKVLAFSAAVLIAAACGRTAKVNAVISDAPSSDIVVKMLNVNAFDVLDTVSLDEAGKLSYKVALDKGQIEFIYLYHSGKRIASLLLKAGDKVTVVADTLGNYAVEGSDESAKLAQVEQEYAAELKKMTQMTLDLENAADAQEAVAMRQAMAQEYISYYRSRVKYLMENSRSMTVVPVLYQTLGSSLPVFAQPTDAIHFKNMADSLALSYPESRYVKALRKEAERRMGRLELQSLLNSAEQIAYPEIELPDINGQKRKLSEVDAKVIIIQFWTATNLEQKLFNIDVLKPLYEEFHSKGLEIYQVFCLIQRRYPKQSLKDRRRRRSPREALQRRYSYLCIFRA